MLEIHRPICRMRVTRPSSEQVSPVSSACHFMFTRNRYVGIHGLIYAIHARMRYSEQNLRITVLEKAPKPQWKVCRKPFFLVLRSK